MLEVIEDPLSQSYENSMQWIAEGSMAFRYDTIRYIQWGMVMDAGNEIKRQKVEYDSGD